MKKNYVKMNDNRNYLSLGNVINIIKKLSDNNVSQTEIFCSIFDINDINNTTVNNYCIGIRAIGIEYRNKFSNIYNKDKLLFIKNVLSIISILDDKIYVYGNDNLDVINCNDKLNRVINELLTIASNDERVSNEFINYLESLEPFYSFIELLNYAININLQPIFKQDINIKINKDELNEYLKVKLYYGQSYISSLIYLASKNNMYACADMGSLWFDGLVNGEIDYDKSFEYYMKAANKNHPKSCWMIANLILTNRVKYDEEVMWKYLNKSIELGSAAGYNTLGLCYKNGKDKLDLISARKNFEIASNMGYVYAFNNLGKLYEEENNIEEAIKYYKISADMNESWALNKVGEYYRLKGDLKTAFIYYNQSINCPVNEIYYYAYYNLSKYYYENGCIEANVKKDKNKSKLYMDLFNKLKNK